jgi:hypothetical protein
MLCFVMRYVPNSSGTQDAVEGDLIVGEIGRATSGGWWWRLGPADSGPSGEGIPREAKAKAYLEAAHLTARRAASAAVASAAAYAALPVDASPYFKGPDPAVPLNTVFFDEIRRIKREDTERARAKPQHVDATISTSPDPVNTMSKPSKVAIPAEQPLVRDEILEAARDAITAALASHDLPATQEGIDRIVDLLDHAIELGASLSRRWTREQIGIKVGALAETTADAAAGIVFDGAGDPAVVDDVVKTLIDVVAMALDAAIDTGSLEDRDADLFSGGLFGLWKLARELGARDLGNLRARAEGAKQAAAMFLSAGDQKRAVRQIQKAERLERIAARIAKKS